MSEGVWIIHAEGGPAFAGNCALILASLAGNYPTDGRTHYHLQNLVEACNNAEFRPWPQPSISMEPLFPPPEERGLGNPRRGTNSTLRYIVIHHTSIGAVVFGPYASHEEAANSDEANYRRGTHTIEVTTLLRPG